MATSINLILRADEHAAHEQAVEEALLGVMLADGPNAVALGRRQVDAALTESIWNDNESGRLRVRLTTDNDIPLQWVAVEATDAADAAVAAEALRPGLRVRDYEDLRAAAAAGAEPGVLAGMALTRDDRLAADLPDLLRRALAGSDVKQRENAVMAAQLSALPGMAALLRPALAHEADPGVAAMLRHALARMDDSGKAS